jgi:hypothetical protein
MTWRWKWLGETTSRFPRSSKNHWSANDARSTPDRSQTVILLDQLLNRDALQGSAASSRQSLAFRAPRHRGSCRFPETKMRSVHRVYQMAALWKVDRSLYCPLLSGSGPRRASGRFTVGARLQRLTTTARELGHELQEQRVVLRRNILQPSRGIPERENQLIWLSSPPAAPPATNGRTGRNRRSGIDFPRDTEMEVHS